MGSALRLTCKFLYSKVSNLTSRNITPLAVGLVAMTPPPPPPHRPLFFPYSHLHVHTYSFTFCFLGIVLTLSPPALPGHQPIWRPEATSVPGQSCVQPGRYLPPGRPSQCSGQSRREVHLPECHWA